MAYLTIELKTNNEGGTSAEVLYSGVDLRVAEQKYYGALAVAATLGRKMHSAVILDSMGTCIASMGYSKEESQTDV